MKKNLNVLIFAVILVAGIFLTANVIFPNNNTPKNGSIKAITVYHSPTCGCCGNYVTYLKRKGYVVDSVQQSDMSIVKSEYKIPNSLESCHTSIIDGYVVEGHIPIEVVEKLLEGKPDIAGIALAGMPSGSPGMPGTKLAPFEVHKINSDGSDGGVFINF